MKLKFRSLFLIALLAALTLWAGSALADVPKLYLGEPNAGGQFDNARFVGGDNADIKQIMIVGKTEFKVNTKTEGSIQVFDKITFTEDIEIPGYGEKTDMVYSGFNMYIVKPADNLENTLKLIQGIKFPHPKTARIFLLDTELTTTGRKFHYSAEKEHFYEYVHDKNIIWQNALVDANNSTMQGRKGYLATITGRPENDFVYHMMLYERNKNSEIASAYFGGARHTGADLLTQKSDGTYELNTAQIKDVASNAIFTNSADTWYWVNGPEQGDEF